jgi:hypothetical protein
MPKSNKSMLLSTTAPEVVAEPLVQTPVVKLPTKKVAKAKPAKKLAASKPRTATKRAKGKLLGTTKRKLRSATERRERAEAMMATPRKQWTSNIPAQLKLLTRKEGATAIETRRANGIKDGYGTGYNAIVVLAERYGYTPHYKAEGDTYRYWLTKK